MFNFSIVKISLLFDPFEQFETNEYYGFVSVFYANISKQLKFWYENFHWFNVWNDSKTVINFTTYIQIEDQLKILHFYTAWIQLYSSTIGLVPDVFSEIFLRDYFIYYIFLIIFISLTGYIVPIMSTNSMPFFASTSLVQLESLKFLNEVIKDISVDIMKYFPYYITMFNFIFLTNILGLIPFVLSVTSTLSVTFLLAISAFIGWTLEAIRIQKLLFLNNFLPTGIAFQILFGLVMIELISNLMKPLSLAIRLFSNMLAGHILTKLFTSFTIDLGWVFPILAISCFIFICVLMCLEVFIAYLQAFMFMLLIALYTNDVIKGDH